MNSFIDTNIHPWSPIKKKGKGCPMPCLLASSRAFLMNSWGSADLNLKTTLILYSASSWHKQMFHNECRALREEIRRGLGWGWAGGQLSWSLVHVSC